MKADTLIRTLETYFREGTVPVVCAYLFGSYARAEQGPDSDVDLAVLFLKNVDSGGVVGPATTLRGDLERLIRREVDLVDMRKAPVDLIHRILRDGRLLLDRDPTERIRFEVDARNRYFDLVPYLRQYRRGRAA